MGIGKVDPLKRTAVSQTALPWVVDALSFTVYLLIFNWGRQFEPDHS